MSGRHYFITGRVQGVFFRDSTRQKANELGVTGWVKNTVDGRVESVAFGTDEQLEKFEQWLRHGPPMAEVTAIEIQSITSEANQSFVIHYT